MIVLAIYLLNLLKLFFLDYRPSFLSAEFDPRECRLDYGKPSGHAIMSTIAIPLVISQLYPDPSGSAKTKVLLLKIAAVFAVTFSRLYLARHSINQLVMGNLYGFSILILWESFFKKLFIRKVLEPVFCMGRVKHEQDHSKTRALKIAYFEKCSAAVRSISKVGLALNALTLLVFGFVRNFKEQMGSEFFAKFENCFPSEDSIRGNFSFLLIRAMFLVNILFGFLFAEFVRQSKYIKAVKRVAEPTSGVPEYTSLLDDLYMPLMAKSKKTKSQMILDCVKFVCCGFLTFPAHYLVDLKIRYYGVAEMILWVSLFAVVPFLSGFGFGLVDSIFKSKTAVKSE